MKQLHSTDLAQALFEEAGDALFLFEPETDVLLDVNPMAVRLTGFSRQELLRMPATYPFRFGGQGGMQRLKQASQKTAVFHSQEGYYLRTKKDGVWIPINMTMARLHVQPKPLALITVRDLREQREAHEQLQKMESELRRVLSSVSDCLWSAEIDGTGRWTYRYISPVVEKLTGRAVELLKPGLESWRTTIHPDDRPRWDAAIRRRRQGEPGREEYRVVWPDGSVHWLRDSVMVSRIEKSSGPVLRLDGVLTDITRNIEDAQAIKSSEMLFRSIWENSRDGMRLVDEQGTVHMANDAYCRMVGKPREALEGQPFAVIYTEERRQTVMQLHQRRFLARTVEPHMIREVTLWNHKPLWLELSNSWLDLPGKPPLLLSVIRDISERKRAEAALRLSEERLQAILDNCTAVIYMKDLEGRYILINRQFETLFHVTREDAKGKTAYDVFPKEFAGPFRAHDQRVLEAGVPLQWEELAPHEDGPHTYLAIKFPLLDSQGRPYALCGISTDITDRKNAEQELHRAKEAAEAANRAKSVFLANMSHEIRTPMNGILGMTDLALDTEVTPVQREYLTAVKASAHALLRVINDILDFSKIEAGRLDLECIPFDIRERLGDALRGMAVQAHDKGLEVVFHVLPDVPQNLLGDPDRLHQVLTNLVGNAIKFTARGQVLIRVEQLSTGHESVELRFSVHDTGIGIPASKREQIFEPFTQADSSTTRRFGGTGLGLTISARLVEMMGGKIWLDSTEGEGSTFYFTARFGLVPGQANGVADSSHLKELSVLVVDDHDTTRAVLGEMLQSWQMRPTLADNNQEGLRLLEEAAARGTPYSLVLLDVGQPEPNGFGLAEQIRQRPCLAGTMILMLSAGGQATEVHRCRELGQPPFVTKPVKQSELFDKIVTTVAGPARAAVGVERVTGAPTAESQIRPLRILLAEDNLVNQRVTLRILEKQGHQVVVANNGREAVQAATREHFDLVLMDLQMPEMGGFEATALLREYEAKSGGRLPIIALTAHAMKGDRERCLEAGMDGYLSKPIQARDLLDLVQRLATAPREPTPALIVPATQLFDLQQALQRVGGDKEILRELLGIFLEEYPKWLQDLGKALEAGNTREVGRLAHMLKGAIGHFAVDDTFQRAQNLEMSAKSGQLEEVSRLLPQLVGDLQAMRPQIEQMLAS